jgi:stage II sporulation protein GA (sporulation sigma-E factor processing peptidase)
MMFWADIPYMYSFGTKLLVSVLMILIAFGYGGPRAFARLAGTFYTVNFATLGGVIGIGTLLSAAGSPWSGMSVTPQGGLVLDWRMQLGLFAAAFGLSIWLFRGTSAMKRKQADTEALLWEAEIRMDGDIRKVSALLDTGNRLYDPLTRMPVMVAEAALWKQLLPEGWADRLQEESADRLVSELDETDRERYRLLSRLRLIPYRGINGTSRMMLAFKPDEVILTREGNPPLTIKRLLIGLDGGTLSPEGLYRAILHPEMIEDGGQKASSAPARLTGG